MAGLVGAGLVQCGRPPHLRTCRQDDAALLAVGKCQKSEALHVGTYPPLGGFIRDPSALSHLSREQVCRHLPEIERELQKECRAGRELCGGEGIRRMVRNHALPPVGGVLEGVTRGKEGVGGGRG